MPGRLTGVIAVIVGLIVGGADASKDLPASKSTTSSRERSFLDAEKALKAQMTRRMVEFCNGTVAAEWLETGRKMKLLREYRYIDPDGEFWIAPEGWVVDGASIPKFLWSLTGGPYEGLYRNASVVHDVECDRKAKPWRAVHRMFYYHMLCSGVEPHLP
jgi:hypothetical protein